MEVWLSQEVYLLVSQWAEASLWVYCWGMEPSMWQLDLAEPVFRHNLSAML
jgi:hypothetical protein